MSLVMSESNRRKQMRESAQGQKGQQPTVVDQELAGMGAPQQPQMPQALPENTGIGTLPQQPMTMAEGGIVAFDVGGGVYAGEGGQFSADPLTTEELSRTDPLAAIKKFGAWAGRNVERDPVTGEVVPKASANVTPATAISAVNPTDARLAASTQMTPMVAPAAAAPTVSPLSTLAPRAPVPRAPAAPELSYADRQKALLGDNPDEDRFATRRAEIATTAEKGAKEGLASLKADQAADMKSMFTGQEERLAKREAELTKSKATNVAMALINGGLSMIKPGPAMQRIAEGAQVGTKQYGEGIAQIKSSQEKLDDARDRIENLRNNANMMNKREIRGEEKGIRDLATQAQRDALAGAEKAYNIKREDIRAAITSDVAVSQAALDRQNRIAVAGMPGDQQKMLTALGGKGGLEAGLTKMQEIQADKTGAAYAKLFTETVAEANKTGATPPTATQFAASLRQLAAAMNPGKVPPAVDATGASRS